jgi:multidrug efflux pump subunit AcrA (membrane-fusion protein)
MNPRNPMNTKLLRAFGCAFASAALAACGGGDAQVEADPYAAEHAEQAAAPTNRVDIPDAVRRNLGVTFAKVESRNVARTLRVPGRFEALPTAHREYRAPLAGRVEILVAQYERVAAGTPLYRIDAPAWRALEEEIIAVAAKVDSMPPLREAHRVHEESLAEKVELWRTRLGQLEALQAAGGGSAQQMTEARIELTSTKAELADVMEKDAILEADEARAQAELRALRARREAILASCGCGATPDASLEHARPILVCAVADGVVEDLGVTQGGLAEEGTRVVTVMQPEKVRFRAHALQGDLARLRDGLAARIAPAGAASLASAASMQGVLAIAPEADPASRTIDLLVTPDALAPWARAGVAGSLEVTLEGGGEELAIPLGCVVRDGNKAIVFRRDPKNPDKAIRLEADLGVDDGRWIVIQSGVRGGDEIVLAGNYQLMLATSGAAPKGGHFHSDGTWHAEDH